MTFGPVAPTIGSGWPAKSAQATPQIAEARRDSTAPIWPPVRVASSPPKATAAARQATNMKSTLPMTLMRKPSRKSSR